MMKLRVPIWRLCHLPEARRPNCVGELIDSTSTVSVVATTEPVHSTRVDGLCVEAGAYVCVHTLTEGHLEPQCDLGSFFLLYIGEAPLDVSDTCTTCTS